MNASQLSHLRTLAELNGVQPSFIDAANQRRNASPQVLSAVLAALGLAAGNEKEIRQSLRGPRWRPCQQGIEPVIVAWEGSQRKTCIYLPAKLASKRMQIRICFEDGQVAGITPSDRNLGVDEIEGERYASREILLPPLTLGYHTLEISIGGKS